jgi:hypothetical protein
MAPSALALNVCVHAGTSSMLMELAAQYARNRALFANSRAPSTRILVILMPVIVRNSWIKSSGSDRFTHGVAQVKSMLSTMKIR